MVGFSGAIQIEEALEKCLPRLAEIHLHDGPWQGPQRSIGYGKDHQALGTGDLDTRWFIHRLQQAAWDGPVIFELSLQQARDSFKHIQSLGL
jgi:sugar phosphate isomerase/epimerase